MKVCVLILLLCPATFAASNEVSRGLAWLASQQRADGSWSTNTALNALQVLAFLSAGNVPASPGYGVVIDRGVRYVLTQQSDDGAFTNGGALMYGHGVTTLLLAEITGMVKRETGVRPRLTKAVELILRAQAVPKGDLHAGGWRYFPDSTDSDLAVTVWQVTALRAALNAGLQVPRKAFERAAHYLQRCEHPRGGFAYQPGGFPTTGRTAAAVLALRMCGHYEEQSLDLLTTQPVAWADEYFYHAAFFCAQTGRGFDG
ncbi:MAG: prenyltransferase/squalene oxidase repeat-containing protein, partial [Verrucomicrobiota bacterium]